MKKLLSKASHKPQNIDAEHWYYEYDSHIEIIHRVLDNEGKFLRTECVQIPKRKLVKSLERMNSKLKP